MCSPRFSSLSLFSRCDARRPILPSFPTRRSSDLPVLRCGTRRVLEEGEEPVGADAVPFAEEVRRERSEEHTSELQSQSNLVCRLLLEKKTAAQARNGARGDRKSTRLNTSHSQISS